jgi:4'-phosphopantetheinyl transferase
MRTTVHIWRCRFDEAACREPQLVSLLSRDEHERAARFRIECSRRQFMIARGVLRDVLSRYSQARPEEIRFNYSRYGKPYLDGSNPDQIAFNLTHSENICLIAVTHGSALGIDVERVKSFENYESLVSEACSSEESATIRSVDSRSRAETFLQIWTRKEAHMKALGQGLSGDFRNSAPGAQWTFHTFSPGDGYIATAAVRACNVHFEIRDWSAWQPAMGTGFMDKIGRL